MRKSKADYSVKAKKVLDTAAHLAITAVDNPTWALIEAATIETPVGAAHLHWKSWRGHGNWTIITNPQWRGEICGTIRCRRVIITPLGGENESIPYDAKTMDEVWNEYQWTTFGAACGWPRYRIYTMVQGEGDYEPSPGTYAAADYEDQHTTILHAYTLTPRTKT